LLRNVEVQHEIARLQAEIAHKLGISAEEVTKRLKQLAFFDIRKLYNQDGSLKRMIDLDDDTAAAICWVQVDQLYKHFAAGQAEEAGTTTKIKLCDSGILRTTGPAHPRILQGQGRARSEGGSVAVAVIGALGCLTPGGLNRYEVAATAHRVETELLRRQCGIQDQIAAAFGGINFIEMDRYPHAKSIASNCPRRRNAN
jgi:hypothetical protein